MKAVFYILTALCFVSPALSYAVDDPSELLPNPEQERRAEAIGQQLRCLVCQNESVEDSSAPLARDLRKIIRSQVAQGWQRRDIIAWMTQRYGDFIRLRPVFNRETALLWIMPFLALGGAFFLARHLWTRPRTSSDHEDTASRRSSIKKD